MTKNKTAKKPENAKTRAKQPPKAPFVAADPLDQDRQKVLAQMLDAAPFDGWTAKTLADSLKSAGIEVRGTPEATSLLLFPERVIDVLDFWSGENDAAMAKAYAEANPKPHKIREKVTFLVRSRIEAMAAHREAARRAAGTLAMPQNAAHASRFTWRTADAIWRALGDTSTDFNHYTKRATLSGVYLSTLGAWFADGGDAPGNTPFAKTWDFLDHRIENVMQFEKLKAKAKDLPFSPEPLLDLLAKLRYPGASSNKDGGSGKD